MANVLAGHILTGKLVCHAQSQQGLMVFCWKAIGIAGAGATLQVVADALSAFAAPLLKPLIYGDAEYRGLTVVNLSEDPVLDEVISVVGQGTGAGGDNALPLDTCGLIRKRTGIRGPTGKGRAYIPFPSTDANDPLGNPSDPYIAAAEDFMAFWTGQRVAGGAGNTTTLIPCLAGANPLVPLPIIAATVAEAWANQHRRGSFGQSNPIPF